jgi:hypothetical protein
MKRRWLVRFRSREVAVDTLAKLRNLPSDHEYIVEEIFAVTDQVEQERQATHGKGLLAELREMILPANRRRIILGVVIFIFMQMAGSNAINVRGTHLSMRHSLISVIVLFS